jgi:hypothetical protein
MRFRHTRRGAWVAAVGATVALALAGPAAAHEGREVGHLAMTVGFAVEPAYAGQPNAVQVDLEHGGQPVNDLGDSLTVTVAFGDASQEVPLEPNFEVGEWGTPGEYLASFIPTQPGSYTFTLVGTVDGEDVDETFSSGPNTFSDVLSPSEATFPKVEAPSNEELASRIEQDTVRAQDAAVAVQEAQDAADRAGTTAMIAVAVAAIAVIVAVGALWSSRRKA